MSSDLAEEYRQAAIKLDEQLCWIRHELRTTRAIDLTPEWKRGALNLLEQTAELMPRLEAKRREVLA